MASRHFVAVVSGPDSTAYSRGSFTLDIVCGPSYPLRPPSVRFRTPVYHPNVSRRDGAICLDMLKPAPAGTWSAARCGLRVMLLSIRELLRAPNTKDPLEPSIVRFTAFQAALKPNLCASPHLSQAQQLEDNPDAFHAAVLEHTQKHAMASLDLPSASLVPATGAAPASAAAAAGTAAGRGAPGRLSVGGSKRSRDDE